MYKKITAITMAMLLLFSLLTGCAKTTPAPAESSSGKKPAETAPAPEADAKTDIGKMEISIATAFSEGDPGVDMMKIFAEKVAEKSGNKIKMNVFSGGTLGGERDIMESLSTGAIEMATVSIITAPAFFATDYNILCTPFLVSDIAECRKILAGPLGDKLHSIYEETGFVSLNTYMDRGLRMLSTNVKVEKPEDVVNLKLRLPENQVYMAVWGGYGATPIPIALTEIYTSLQTGVVQAQENPYATIYANKFYEVQKYIVKTQHVIDLYETHASKQWWDKLNDAEKAVFKEALAEACEIGNELTKKSEEELEGVFVKAGVEIITPDREAFKAAAQPAVDKLVESYFAKDCYDLFKASK